jgi:hypothetical protein
MLLATNMRAAAFARSRSVLRVPTLRLGCDRCGAHAQVVAVFPDGNNLMFCGHHALEYADELDRCGAVIIPLAD